MPRAGIDIGSNTLLLLVVDDTGRVLHDEARVIGLGRGLGDRGLMTADRLEAADACLGDYVRIAATLGVEAGNIRAVATSAARRALNAATWTARLQRDLGLRVRILSGEEEARLTWLGAMRDLELPEGPLLVVDLGGGSTEIVLGEGDVVHQRLSLEIGSVRLTEAFLGGRGGAPYDPVGLARLRSHVDAEMSKVVFDPIPRTVIAVAGTATTLATMVLELSAWDGERVHGSRLTRLDLARCSDRLLPAGAAARRALVPAAPDRADYLLAGAAILDRVLSSSRRSQMTVSDRGLRFGVVAG
ncbi:MAG: exopolyphosphatase [Deltaproteobacteria bacterium]|nr:exopolyphosphatase [Deltaproteobacteria bacterium]